MKDSCRNSSHLRIILRLSSKMSSYLHRIFHQPLIRRFPAGKEVLIIFFQLCSKADPIHGLAYALLLREAHCFLIQAVMWKGKYLMYALSMLSSPELLMTP